MQKFHTFFFIGIIGMLVIPSLHMFLALGLSVSSVHSTFLALYPLCIAFLAIGFGLTLKSQKESKRV